MLLRLFASLLFLFFSLTVGTAFAQEPAEDPGNAEVLQQLQVRLEAARNDASKLAALRAPADRLRSETAQDMEEAETKLQETRVRLQNALADPDPALRANAATLASEVAALEKEVHEARGLAENASEFYHRLSEARRRLFHSRLFDHVGSPFEPNFWKIFALRLPTLATNFGILLKTWHAHLAEENGYTILLIIAVAFLTAMVGLYWLHKRMRRIAHEESHDPDPRTVAIRAVVIVLMRSLPILVFLTPFLLAEQRFDIAPDNFDEIISGFTTALIVTVSSWSIAMAAYSPSSPHYRVVWARDGVANCIASGLVMSVAIYATSLVILSILQCLDAAVDVEAVALLVFSLAAVAVGARTLHKLGRLMEYEDEGSGLLTLRFSWMRPLLWLALVVILGAALAGYLSLAAYLVGRVLAILVVGLLAIILLLAIDALIGEESARTTPLGNWLQSELGLNHEALALTLAIVAGLLRLLIVLAAASFLFGSWNLDSGAFNLIPDSILGFRITDVRATIGAAGVAGLFFAAGLVGTRVLVGWLDSRVLPVAVQDRGIRQSVTTIIGYAGIAAAFALALNQLGVNLQNLTIIAGALSVGVGFGMQSVVSNFVSGLIVLAERPVRVGDRIVVKGEEGKVRRISVRSTQIDTAEKSILIVPNTDLITSIVRNRTLGDTNQKVKVTVTVSLLSDPQVVCDALVAAASNHPNILEKPAPKPSPVKFNDYGMEFEIGFVIIDVEQLSDTRSDVHLAVYREFRKRALRIAVPKA